MCDADAAPAELRHVVGREVHAMRAPHIPRHPAELLHVFDRGAAELLLRELRLLDRLGQVRVEAQTEPAREVGGLAHELPGHRERRARRDGDLHPRAVRELRGLLGRGEHVVAVLHDRVGRQAAVRLAEVHRAARRNDAHAELARRADLRLEQPGAAGWEQVVMVEDGRAARERELRQPGARGRVLRLVV